MNQTKDVSKSKHVKLAKREEVVEHSRRHLGMPREEVEVLIAEQMGWPTPEQEHRKHINRIMNQLQEIGVTERQAKYIIASYSLERIQQQIDWLPYRGARNSTAFIISAIRHNYDPPVNVYPVTSSNNNTLEKNEEVDNTGEKQDKSQANNS